MREGCIRKHEDNGGIPIFECRIRYIMLNDGVGNRDQNCTLERSEQTENEMKKCARNRPCQATFDAILRCKMQPEGPRILICVFGLRAPLFRRQNTHKQTTVQHLGNEHLREAPRQVFGAQRGSLHGQPMGIFFTAQEAPAAHSSATDVSEQNARPA